MAMRIPNPLPLSERLLRILTNQEVACSCSISVFDEGMDGEEGGEGEGGLFFFWLENLSGSCHQPSKRLKRNICSTVEVF